MIILGIDPSLRGTGFGLITGVGGKWKSLAYGVLRNKPTLTVSECLVSIEERLGKVLDEFRPDVASIEGVFYLQNLKTAITLGHARGVLIATVAKRGIPIHEYAPRKIKQAVVGRGGAQKHQVAEMLRPLLGLKELPPPDAADALAIALTHANNLTLLSGTQGQRL